ncbi:MAG: hypothetical protein J5I98_26230 [Phaeodactylibacter sp.]|nr:hypothetical protein [Phaeodactylibacter sp.]
MDGVEGESNDVRCSGLAVLSFFVLFPWRYRYNPDSPEDIRRAFARAGRVKRTVLAASAVCYLVALGLGVGAYLGG